MAGQEPSIIGMLQHFQPSPSVTLIQLLSSLNDVGIIFSSLFIGTLIPVTVNFILFSTHSSRSKSMFWVQSLMLACAYAESLLYLIQSAQSNSKLTIIDDGAHYNLLNHVHSILRPFVTLLADLTLLLKVLNFYSPLLHSFCKRILVVSPAIILGLARIGVLIGMAVVEVRSPLASDTFVYLLIINVLEAVDNIYLSGILLYQSHKLFRIRTKFQNSTSRPRLQYLIESIFLTFIPAILVQILSLCFFLAGPIESLRGFKSEEGGGRGYSPAVALLINGNLLNDTIHKPAYLAWLACAQLNVMFSVHFSLLATTWSTLRETRIAIQSGAISPDRSSQAYEDEKKARSLERRDGHPTPTVKGFRQRTVLSYIASTEIVEVLTSIPEETEEDQDRLWWRGDRPLPSSQ